MLFQVTDATVEQQGLDQSDIGRWYLVVLGCHFIFDSQEAASAFRAMMRSYLKWNKIVH